MLNDTAIAKANAIYEDIANLRAKAVRDEKAKRMEYLTRYGNAESNASAVYYEWQIAKAYRKGIDIAFARVAGFSN